MPTDVCPSCKSIHTVKAGFKITKQGKRQRKQCSECGSTFYPKGGDNKNE